MRSVLVIAGRLAFFKKPQEVSSPSGSYGRKTIDNWKTFAKSQDICLMVVLLMDCVSPFLRSQRTLCEETENNDGALTCQSRGSMSVVTGGCCDPVC